MPYTLPNVGTVLPAKENDSIPNPGPTRDRAMFNRWLQAQNQHTAFLKNLVLAEEYDNENGPGTFQSWRDFGYYTGRATGPTGIVGDPDAIPPQPPAAYIVIVQDGQIFSVEQSGKPAVMDERGENVIEQATGPRVPVCAVPAYRRITPPQHGGGSIATR